MDSSSNLRPRKRKQCSSSDRLNGRFTRSKSRMHAHNTRSGRTWADTAARKPFDKSQLFRGKPKNVHQPSPENEALLDLSIKDLRTRARRVFSPSRVLEGETQKFKMGIGFSEKSCNGASKIVDDSENLNLGLKNSDIDSDLGFICCGKEQHRGREDVALVPMDADRVLGLGSHGQPDKEEDMTLNEKTPIMEKKYEGNNNVESGKDCTESKRDGSVSGSRQVLNPSSKRKVFKAPSSFSYRRLLPYLMTIAKDDDSGFSKFDVVDMDNPYKFENISNVDSNSSSAFTDCYAGKSNDIDDHSDHTKTLDEDNYLDPRVQLPVNRQDFDDPTNKIAKTEENIEVPHMKQRNQKSGMNEVDALIEENVQTTPPDDTLFSKLDNVGASQEFSAAQIGNHALEKSSSNNASNSICISMKVHPARKNNSISNAKLVLNPCSRPKIFKTSSFSYRRLLPFLTDVSKRTTNTDVSPKPDGHFVSKESVDAIPVNRTTTDDFLENQYAEDQEPFSRTVNPSASGTSHDTIPNMSTPFFSSGDRLPDENLNRASSDAIAKPDKLPLSERISQYELVTSDSSANVMKSCCNENNCLAETSCSSVHQESFTRESKSDVSQVSEHEPTDVATECMALGLDYAKDKLQLVRSVTPCQSSLEIEEFGHQGNQIDSPTKGILKRNPRGCRGLCNCLNCSSFRLHAERSFEFSKNQMLDTEEVAHVLINELAKLRSLLENPASGHRDLVAVQINQLQAKEACEMALRTEELAKTRLNQMNYDLKIHCRIRPSQRPRVSFSRFNEEIAIPKTDLSASINLLKKDEKKPKW